MLPADVAFNLYGIALDEIDHGHVRVDCLGNNLSEAVSIEREQVGPHTQADIDVELFHWVSCGVGLVTLHNMFVYVNG
jgi:hypothetical protein